MLIDQHGGDNQRHRGREMNGNRYYGVRVEGAKYGVGFGSALAIAISYTTNHSILWAIIHGILGWLYVIYFALFRSWSARNRPQPRLAAIWRLIAAGYRCMNPDLREVHANRCGAVRLIWTMAAILG
jgi:hypothetical protein